MARQLFSFCARVQFLDVTADISRRRCDAGQSSSQRLCGEVDGGAHRPSWQYHSGLPSVEPSNLTSLVSTPLRSSPRGIISIHSVTKTSERRGTSSTSSAMVLSCMLLRLPRVLSEHDARGMPSLSGEPRIPYLPNAARQTVTLSLSKDRAACSWKCPSVLARRLLKRSQ
jgi:hypothetical protein